MNRRQFLSAVGGGLLGAGFLPSSGIAERTRPEIDSDAWQKMRDHYEQEVELCAEIKGPWHNPVDVLTELLSAWMPPVQLDSDSFARIRSFCEIDRRGYVLSGQFPEDGVLACLTAAGASLEIVDGVAYLVYSYPSPAYIRFRRVDSTVILHT